MVRFVCFLQVLALASAVWAQEPEQPPPPLVTGDSVALQPAVSGLTIVCDNWPDASSLAQFGRDATRIERAETNEQKAIAVWRWMRRCTMFTGTGTPCEPPGGYMSDPNKVLNIYGAHHCDGLSRLMAALWRESQGLPARKLYRSGHTMADCWWIDSDGVGRYHMFDNNYGYFLFDRAGEHIVTADDIGADFSLVHFPSRTLEPWIEKQYWMWAWCHVAWPEPDAYDGTMALHAGEQAEMLWGNVGRPYHANMLAARPDPDGGPQPMDYGNSVWRLREGFDSLAWQGRLAAEPVNVLVTDGRLAQADASAAGAIVYRVRLPHVVADVDLVLKASAAGTIAVDTSVDDGRNWRAGWTFPVKAGQQVAGRLSDVQPKFDDANAERRARPSRTTPLGRYDFLLRVTLTGGAGLDSLEATTIAQQNYLVLPNLVPGENAITAKGELGQGAALEITYIFDDADAKGKRHVARAESLPYRYTVAASGRRLNDVYCRSLTVRAVAADGRGNRVVETPAAPKVAPEGGRPQTLDWRVLGAVVPEAPEGVQEYAGVKPMTDEQAWELRYDRPKLKKTSEYIADLASEDLDTRRTAAAGLAVLRDKSACDALEKVAINDTTVAKYYAIQALFWTDRERAWPVMERILKRDGAIRFAADASGRTEAPTCLNVCAMVAALAGRAQMTQAIPLIDQALQRESKWWDEPRWAMIRALGRMHNAAARPIVQRYIRSGPSDKRVVAIYAAIELEDHESIPVIAGYLNVKGWNMLPDSAMWALSRLGSGGADYTDDILPHLASDRADRRWLAADALAVTGDPAKALPAVQGALEKETFAYGRERMKLAIEELQKRLKDASAEASASRETP